jgi:hypothetical protein
MDPLYRDNWLFQLVRFETKKLVAEKQRPASQSQTSTTVKSPIWIVITMTRIQRRVIGLPPSFWGLIAE